MPFMHPLLIVGFLSVVLFFVMLLFYGIGRRLGEWERARFPDIEPGAGPTEAAIFALLGLLMAFTFSSAASRFDTRRELIVTEANAIGTAWLRIDLLREPDQPALRELFRQYLDARLASYHHVLDSASLSARQRSLVLQHEIWGHAMRALRIPPDVATKTLVTQSLNDMFDIETTRTRALYTHAPAVIFGLLMVSSLLSVAFAGYAMEGTPAHRWSRIVGFAAILTVTIYTIVDLEFPRFGIIRVDAADQVLWDLRREMGESENPR